MYAVGETTRKQVYGLCSGYTNLSLIFTVDNPTEILEY
jgi:hypothetical protein